MQKFFSHKIGCSRAGVESNRKTIRECSVDPTKFGIIDNLRKWKFWAATPSKTNEAEKHKDFLNWLKEIGDNVTFSMFWTCFCEVDITIKKLWLRWWNWVGPKSGWHIKNISLLSTTDLHFISSTKDCIYWENDVAQTSVAVSFKYQVGTILFLHSVFNFYQ